MRSRTRGVTALVAVGVLGAIALSCSSEEGAPGGGSSGSAGSDAAGSGGTTSQAGKSSGGTTSTSEAGRAPNNSDAGSGGMGGAGNEPSHEIVIYGCTSGGIIAAVQATHLKKSVILVCPEQHLGGLSSQGLGWTDTGDNSVIGGLSRDFYARVKKAYDDDARWKQQTKASYSHYSASADSMWVFEPHVAEEIFEALVSENGLDVRRDEWLDREAGVESRARPSLRSRRSAGRATRAKSSSTPATKAT